MSRSHLKVLKRLARNLRNEQGSAALEFVLLAIPLFIPLFFYMNSFSTVTSGEYTARTLARESARAYTLSENDAAAENSAREVIYVGALALGYSKVEAQNISTEIDCEKTPCLSPNARVRVTVTIHTQDNRDLRASAQEYVSPWK